MKNRISKNFHLPLNSLSGVKTAKSSLARGHQGGADWGYLELRPGTPAIGWGVHIQENRFSGPRSKYTHIGHNTQRSFHPPSKKKGYPGAGGGYGGQNPKNNWGIIVDPKMMILQGVRHRKPYIGVCYANDPKKGGYTTLAPALDLTTSLQGDFVSASQCGHGGTRLENTRSLLTALECQAGEGQC